MATENDPHNTVSANHNGCFSKQITILTPWCRVLIEKPTGSQLVKKFSEFYGTRRFITAFTRARHLSISWSRPIQCPSHFLKIHLDIILPSMPGSSKWSLSLRFPHQNPAYTSPRPHTCYMPRPYNYSRFDYPNNIWWVVGTTNRLCESLKLHSLRPALYIQVILNTWTHS